MYTKLITLSAVLAVAVAGLASGSAAAPSACPEALQACQPIGDKPAEPKRRALFQLIRIRSAACGSETFAIVVDGKRRAILC